MTPPLVSPRPENVITAFWSHTISVPQCSVRPSSVNGSCTACEHDGPATAADAPTAGDQRDGSRQVFSASVGATWFSMALAKHAMVAGVGPASAADVAADAALGIRAR